MIDPSRRQALGRSEPALGRRLPAVARAPSPAQGANGPSSVRWLRDAGGRPPPPLTAAGGGDDCAVKPIVVPPPPKKKGGAPWAPDAPLLETLKAEPYKSLSKSGAGLDVKVQKLAPVRPSILGQYAKLIHQLMGCPEGQVWSPLKGGCVCAGKCPGGMAKSPKNGCHCVCPSVLATQPVGAPCSLLNGCDCGPSKECAGLCEAHPKKNVTTDGGGAKYEGLDLSPNQGWSAPQACTSHMIWRSWADAKQAHALRPIAGSPMLCVPSSGCSGDSQP